MLNYLNAELWRMTRQRRHLVWCAIFLGLIALTTLIWWDGSLLQAMDTLDSFLVVGLYLCFPLAALAGGDMWRIGTVRNEVSAGLSRGRIYLGKLCAALLYGLILLLVAVVFYMVIALVATAGQWPEDMSLVWNMLGHSLLQALPRYIGGLGLAHFLSVCVCTGGLAPVLYYLYITLGELVLSTNHFIGLGAMGAAINALSGALRPFLLTGNFFQSTHMMMPSVPQSWLVGLCWTGISTGLGIAIFSRREIR